MGGSNNRSRRRRVGVVLGALTLSLVGAVGTAAPASADQGDITNRTGSIIIHKHEHQTGTPVEVSPDGSATIPSAPISGVTFTAYKLDGIDLMTQAGWDAVKTVSATCPPPAGSTNAGSATTGSTGRAEIDGLAVGAYIVCETDAPTTVVDRAQPFVVTIPFPYKRTSGTPSQSWLYEVNVYPKNGVASVAKTVDVQAELGLGATATFPVTTQVRKIDTDSSYTHYWVQDLMPSQVTPGPVTSVTLGGTALTVDVDYKVTTSGQLVTVEFTQAGLRALKTAGNTGPVELIARFTGVVNSVSANGQATDTAYLSAATEVRSDPPANPEAPKSPGDPGYVGTPSDPVTQRWGDLKVTKLDKGDETTGLAGAKFLVFEAADPHPSTGGCTTAIKTGATPIVVGSLGDADHPFTTGAGGALTIDGLFVSDSVHTPTNATERCYVLQEVEAPAGYITPEGAAALMAVAVQSGTTAPAITITNTRVEGVTLPMTGSNGIVALSVAGTALIAAGLVLGFMARRRRQTA